MAAALVLALLTLVAGMGWLYLLRDLGLFGVGPNLARALPLEQLARGDDQPLLRVAIAWLPAGIVAGLALAWGTGLGRAARALVLGLLAAVVLLASGAVADAVAVSGQVANHVGNQFSQEGIWTEVGLFVIGSLLVAPGRRRAGPRAAAAAATRR